MADSVEGRARYYRFRYRIIAFIIIEDAGPVVHPLVCTYLTASHLPTPRVTNDV